MTAMKAVEKTYMFSNESTKVLKEKRFDYKNGASITETTLVKKVYSKRYALLECGHTREQHSSEHFEGAKRLSCHYCDQIAWHEQNAQATQTPQAKKWLEDCTQSALNNLEMAKLHMLQHP
jgi:hypothetical protein